MKILDTEYLLSSILLIIILVLSSCAGEESVDTLQEFLAKNNINADQTSSGLYFEIISTGSGPSIEEDKFVVFNVTQFDLENNVIGSSVNTGFPIALAVTTLIPGLQEGLELLNEGGIANFFIPPALSGGSIQSGALIYGVEVLYVYNSLTDYNDGEIEKYLIEQELSSLKTPEGLYYIIEEEGEDPRPNINSTVTIDYHGYFLDGDVFDSSIERGVPSSFSLSDVIEGWQLGIPLFGTGGKGKLLIPSYLAYGEQGNASIPGNYPIAFDVEVITVE